VPLLTVGEDSQGNAFVKSVLEKLPISPIPAAYALNLTEDLRAILWVAKCIIDSPSCNGELGADNRSVLSVVPRRHRRNAHATNCPAGHDG
jgi:hypothetical protein